MAQKIKRFVLDQAMFRAGALRVVGLMKSLQRSEPGLYSLLYHRVPAAQRENFARQLDFVRRFGRFVSADEAVALLQQGWRGRDRAFLLTFDDGRADNVDVALPVLRARGIPAIQFLVGDWLEAPPAATGRADGYMTRADAAAWVTAGMSLGSHTASHPRLSRLDAAGVRAELERSREVIGPLAGGPLRHFACPWGVADGDYQPGRDPALAQACGFETFFTTRRGRAAGPSDLLSMPRHVVEPHWAFHEIEARLGGWRHAGG